MSSKKVFRYLVNRKRLFPFLFIFIAIIAIFFLLSRLFVLHRSLFVVDVIDGDTVILNTGEKVRYLGIDTPECRIHKNGMWVEVFQPFSREAREFNKKLVEGKQIRLEFDRVKRDKYGRLLAYVWVNNTLVNEKLLKEGLAYMFFMWPNEKYARRFCSAQLEAIRERKGVWADRPIIPPEEAERFKGYVRLVRGNVCKVINTGRAVLLYLKCDIPRFRVVLPYTHFGPTGRLRFYNSLEGKEINSLGKIRCKRKECEQVLFDSIQFNCLSCER